MKSFPFGSRLPFFSGKVLSFASQLFSWFAFSLKFEAHKNSSFGNWLPFYRPYSFASPSFGRFAIIVEKFIRRQLLNFDILKMIVLVKKHPYVSFLVAKSHI